MLIFNTKTRTKEVLTPVEEGKVGIYACGPTVYNHIHIGNARQVVVFDTLTRYLRWRGYDVTFVQNFTDIDDKMINKANAEGVTIKELADRYIKAYFDDTKGLNLDEGHMIHPKATEHISEIIALVQHLIDKGLAYVTKDGVYFDTKAFPAYGELSGQDLDDLESGARIDVDDGKKHPMDFAVWKAKKPGEPFWDAPFGAGRPGWHIECSAMSMKYLGESFDIHGGGQDLVFPHHENEKAQSEGATGKPFVKYWMHNGFLNVDGVKMSKSLNNFWTLEDIAKEYDMEVARYFLVAAQYRSPLNFSKEMMEQSKAALERLYTARDNYTFLLTHGGTEKRAPNEKETAFLGTLETLRERFISAMDDDLNTAGALGVLFDLVREGNLIAVTGASDVAVEAALNLLNELAGVLGLLYKSAKGNDEDAEVQELVAQRAQARKDKNWAESDRLRDLIKSKGYILEDTPQGAKVRKA